MDIKERGLGKKMVNPKLQRFLDRKNNASGITKSPPVVPKKPQPTLVATPEQRRSAFESALSSAPSDFTFTSTPSVASSASPPSLLQQKPKSSRLDKRVERVENEFAKLLTDFAELELQQGRLEAQFRSFVTNSANKPLPASSGSQSFPVAPQVPPPPPPPPPSQQSSPKVNDRTKNSLPFSPADLIKGKDKLGTKNVQPKPKAPKPSGFFDLTSALKNNTKFKSLSNQEEN